MGHLVRIAAAVLLSSTTLAAEACPVCDSEQGRQVRAGVFDEDFVSNTLQTIAVFPVIVGVIVALYVAFPNTPGEKDGNSDVV